MTAYFLNAGDAFVVSTCYSVSCPTNTIPCEGRGALHPCGEEFKPLFMRYRSSLDRFRCNPCCGSTPAPTLFSRNLPTSDLPFSSNGLRHPSTSRIARPWGYHTATFPPRRYAHSRTRLLHLFDVAGQDNTECNRPTVFTGRPLLTSGSDPITSHAVLSHGTEDRL